MTVAEAIKRPTATVVILAEVTAGLWARAWVVDGTYTNTYKLTTTFTDLVGKTQQHTVTDVLWNLTTSLTARASAALVDANAGSWYHDGTQLWVRPLTGSIFDATIQAMVKFYFGTHQKVLNDIGWLPRVKSAPSISQRIEAVFGDVSQVGGGDLSFDNLDGFFSVLDGLQWDAGTVVMKLGVDLPGTNGAMAWADYVTLATWRVDTWSDDGEDFILRLREPKARIKADLPIGTFTRDDYPNIDDDNVGKAIPLAYGQNVGVAPVVIDPGNKTFKVAGHAIRSFDGVRVKKTRAELIVRATSTLVWLDYSADVKRFYIADEVVKTVNFKGTVLTEVNDVDDVVATASRWAYSENYVYVRPPSTENWSAGSVTIESEQHSPAMITTDFASVDLSNGEFTLGDDWAVGTDVAVDFRGKVDGSGNYLENAIDIIEDLLTVAGETNLNASAFATARARLVLGTDESGFEVNLRRPSLYVTETESFLSLIGKVLKLARSYLYSDANGQYTVGVFRPQRGEALSTVSDMEILSLERIFDMSNLVTKIVASYQDRPVDGFAQTLFEESDPLRVVHQQPQAASSEIELPTYYDTDARYWSQAMICLLGKPLAKHQIVLPWKYLQLAPGDQIWVQSDEHQIDQVYEILEKRIDVGTMKLTFVLGNLRAFEDTPGFWVANAGTIPARFSQLAGYSAGSQVWNASWDDEIRSWARQNIGYWTDANGFAKTTDAKSFLTSVWT